MRARGSFKIAHRRDPKRNGVIHENADSDSLFDARLGAILREDRRHRRILDSLRSEIVEGGASGTLRIRQIFQSPREIYRLELELPELGYQRTTLLDRDALEELLEADEVRAAVGAAARGH